MADNEAQQHDRTEQPSAKRLEDARRRGQVPRSRELGTAAVTLAGAAVLLAGRANLAAGFSGLLERGLELPRAALLDTTRLPAALGAGIAAGIQLLAPLMIAVVAAGVLGAVALGGWSFSFEALAPNFGKLNPLAGLRRIFGWNGLAELAKSLAKFALVALAAAVLFSYLAPDFLALGSLTLENALVRAAWLVGASFTGLAATLIVIAAADAPFQHWQYRRQLRMTKQEAKDEQKETEGRPEVRSRIRQLQRAIATRRMMADVPKADLVAMNPTHYAVALRYDAAKMKAPRVVAKGQNLIALNIRRVAEKHGVPVFEHPEFARALYFTSEIGAEISPRLYVAVAQVLTYIYQLTGKALPGGRGRAAAAGARKAPPQKPALDIAADLLVPRRKGKATREGEGQGPVSVTGGRGRRGGPGAGTGVRHLGDA
jgi:flagellar biosynthetic protein FlhB